MRVGGGSARDRDRDLRGGAIGAAVQLARDELLVPCHVLRRMTIDAGMSPGL